ncbi:MAG TPA: hypothetical protein VG651_07625 [Stellaceae bacterium]|nr:hypothetical protein [Stellaceae bacterium]
MTYQDPSLVKAPKGAITHLHVIYDGGEQTPGAGEWSGWSVAELEWHEEPTMACRWNGSTENAHVSAIGNPQSRGNPTWFIIPRPLQEAVREKLRDAPMLQRERALVHGAAEASATAFARVWSNPEDDVYDAL